VWSKGRRVAKPEDASGRDSERGNGRERRQARKGLFPVGPADGWGKT